MAVRIRHFRAADSLYWVADFLPARKKSGLFFLPSDIPACISVRHKAELRFKMLKHPRLTSRSFMAPMNNRFAPAVLTALSFVALLNTASVAKGQYYWTGTGTWDTSTNNIWGLTSGGPYNQFWVNASLAVFEGTAGTVTRGTDIISAEGLSFTTGGYSITGSSLILGASGINISATSGTTSISNGISIAASQTWTNNSSGTFTLSTSSNNIALDANTLTLDGTGNFSLGKVISGTGGLIKNGSGTVTIPTLNNLYSGVTNINQGIVTIQSTSPFGTTAGGTIVANGAEIQAIHAVANSTQAEPLTLNGTGVSGLGAYRKLTGAFTTTISGAITIASNTRINSEAGTLVISGAIGAGLNNLTVGGAGAMTISGLISQTGTFTKSDAGTLIVNSTQTNWTGPINITGGTLNIATTLSLGNSATQPITISNDAILSNTQVTATAGASFMPFTRPLVIASGGATLHVLGNTSTSGSIIGGTTTVELGANTLTKSGADILSIARIVNGTGTINVSQGTLLLRTDNDRISDSISVTVATGATFGMAGLNDTINALNGNGTVTSASGTPTLGVGGNNGTGSFTGVITGPITLAKVGAGTQTLTGANTYTGATNINAGTLLINGAHTGTGATTVGLSGTLGGSGSLNSLVIVNGTIAPGNSIGALTVNNTVTFNTGSNYVVELAATGVIGNGNSDVIFHQGMTINGGNVSFTLTSGTPAHTDVFTIAFAPDNQPVTGNFTGLPNGSVVGTYNSEPLYIYYNQTVADAVAGTFASSPGSIILTPVPEPTTILAVGALAFAAMGGIRRLRRRDTASPALAA
jgi:fibronectin-binding autotransporter adhesin